MSQWRLHDERRRGDDGLVTSALVATVAVAVVAVIMIAVLPLLSGTEQASRTQTSADAAALAGAASVREFVLENLDSVVTESGGVSFGALLGPSRGYSAALDYAGRNGADLAEYRYDASADTVYAHAALRERAPNGGHSQSEATTELGVALARCVFTRTDVVVGFEPLPAPTPEPSGSPTPAPTLTPTPVPIYGSEYRVRCPGFDSGASDDLDDVFDATYAWLDGVLEPRLVQ